MFARIFLAFFAAALPLGVTAQSEPIVQKPGASIATLDQGADHFVAGRSVRVAQPVSGDLIAAGGRVDIDAAVNGDAVVAGGDVRIRGTVSNSLYAAGGQLVLDATVGRNARIAGGRVEIDPRASVAGNVSIAGGEVRIDGAVKGYVQAAGGRVLINGPVGGEVVATSGAVELGPSARIAGKLRYTSRSELKRDPAAQVTGGFERVPMAERSAGHRQRPLARAGGWLWTAGLVLMAVVLVAALPAFTARVAGTLHTRVGMSLLIGFVALVCIPVAAILLVFTLIGIPFALLALVLYCALLMVGYAMTGIGIGDWLLGRFRVADAARVGWRIGAAALAMLMIALLARVPWVGALVSLMVLIAGLGAVVMQARQASSAGT
ncbi:MAG TPA: polymer-forming cytoskeletal protein [Burkholderiaceae bacterium]|nr:polymer-forming cytoskeletal protein [Burkholderiaceae bacterium]